MLLELTTKIMEDTAVLWSVWLSQKTERKLWYDEIYIKLGQVSEMATYLVAL